MATEQLFESMFTSDEVWELLQAAERMVELYGEDAGEPLLTAKAKLSEMFTRIETAGGG